MAMFFFLLSFVGGELEKHTKTPYVSKKVTILQTENEWHKPGYKSGAILATWSTVDHVFLVGLTVLRVFDT